MSKLDYADMKMTSFLAMVENRMQTEEVGDLFQLLLTKPEEFIERDINRIGFPVEVGEELFTEEILDAIAFGILWEQQSKDAVPQIVAPFGFYSLEEVCSSQAKKHNSEVEEFFWYTLDNSTEWLQKSLDTNEVTEYCELPEQQLAALYLSISFGVLLESTPLEKASLPEYIQEEIKQKYGLGQSQTS